MRIMQNGLLNSLLFIIIVGIDKNYLDTNFFWKLRLNQNIKSFFVSIGT